jgi:hypothetical protein
MRREKVRRIAMMIWSLEINQEEDRRSNHRMIEAKVSTELLNVSLEQPPWQGPLRSINVALSHLLNSWVRGPTESFTWSKKRTLDSYSLSKN